jgi:hypothetical protein
MSPGEALRHDFLASVYPLHLIDRDFWRLMETTTSTPPPTTGSMKRPRVEDEEI